MSKQLILPITILFIAISAFAQQTPVEGDEWIKLLGQRNASPAVSDVLSYIGNNGNLKGLKATVKENILVRLDFFNDNNPWGADIKKFPGKLPKGLDLSMNIAQCKTKLGEGFEFEGEVSGTYVLHKNFELDNKDAYQINIEFLEARLNSVALIYESGGAKKFSQSGEENKSGINGDDFMWLIKKNTGNKTYGDLVTAVGEPNIDERLIKIFANGGVELRLNSDLNIDTITFFSGGQSAPQGHIRTYKPFILPMPLGVKFGDSHDDILKKAGPPTKDEGSKLVYKQDYTLVNINFDGGKVATVQLTENPDYKVNLPKEKAKPRIEAPGLQPKGKAKK